MWRMTRRRTFAKCLSECRQAACLSQEQLADKAGLRRTCISQLERGLKGPALEVLAALAEPMDMSFKSFWAQLARRLGP
ncbi:MAG: hypothetical protein CJBNEKGG_01508 [Prosthecobacter sp.]|nr:hypothetical protein [Prosthecobacter sp.]